MKCPYCDAEKKFFARAWLTGHLIMKHGFTAQMARDKVKELAGE